MSGRVKSHHEVDHAAETPAAARAEERPLPSRTAEGVVGHLLQLQQTHGNRAVGALLNSGTLRRKLASPLAQPQALPVLRRKCDCGGTCDDCKEELRRSATSPAAVSEAPGIVHEVLGSPGRPLDIPIRSYFESRFQHDFSGVRIHTNSAASDSANSVHASAYTVGHNIVFGPDRYKPESESGRRLLAHELAHVVQQGSLATSTIQRKIPIGAVDDPAEHEADRMADAALSGTSTATSHVEPSAVIRRAPLTPQKIDETRKGTVTLMGGDTVDVSRTFRRCPCSKVSDTRTGIFYNPDLQSLAIAYRHCRGATTFDVYLKTATDFSQGNLQGSGQIGIDVNVWGKTVQGRVIVELVGENQGSGPGVGGHAKLVLQGGQWRVILEPKFLRAIGQQNPGVNPNQLEVNLGAKYGKYSVEIGGKDLLSPTRDFTAAGCYELSSSVRICGQLDVQGRQGGGSPNVTPSLVFKGEFGEGAREEKCYNCLCPPPVKKFTCQGHHPVAEKKPDPIKDPRTPEFRYYFHWDTTANSEESYLRDESSKNMDDMAALIKRGYTITSIAGFASPEGSEGQINDPLATARGKKTAEIVKGKVDSSVKIPEPIPGRSELLGRNPSAPDTHLRDAIKASGLHSAEDVTPLLTGAEITQSKMTKEFLDLFDNTSADEWMQLFGLSPDNPIRPQVEKAVRTFIASRGAGPRPWEQVFRLLRFGAIHLSGFEMIPDTKTPVKPAHDEPFSVGDDDCKDYGARAEKEGSLGPIADELLHPTASDADTDESCYDPAPADKAAGCKYDLPADLTGTVAPAAPDFAPKQFGK